MSERIKLLENVTEQVNDGTKFIKKAVLTSVGAGTDVERVKSVFADAMQDLVKVGQNLIDELEEKGKEKAETMQDFLKNLQTEAVKKTSAVEKQVSTGVRKAVREIGLITQEDWEEMCDRLNGIEEALGVTHPDSNGAEEKPRRRKKSS